ncbi:uncharacterized protein L3040_002243 [Drepanopeziza brunnea f. sp. 'multigermtubi']|uniref:RNA polymerase II subunit B1 CTD phosphatase RPAP2 homolog n=1 Tax=Marssonina brunnea f. sp. multigermtubi (strain MB_m1) TaxID=1072389 RepID=K1X4I1_MARBU|nr:putative DUF408 domain protein [Drepanopeziza brunnea f. sp. 'multigermtubi' MB_m1]EKD20081.1 putative DUF408 domain protein [Drepanopeziza brunnea f. sp. 'multigermtubi' MB_m1]KAJ5050360.1 hypothetical protein L3040_002243 [Drepanopeziza brunnea f. sp. 'multigermtubi']
MTTAHPPKSILKKYPSSSSSDKYKTIQERNLEVALYHANLIQRRKDIELEILLALESLIDYPLSPPTIPSPASRPSPSDIATFRSHLTHFTPSDYDALIHERNINQKCGYALCPQPLARDAVGGEFRILGIGGRAKDFRVVKREALERWCAEGKGESCKRRAMWVRVQLEECPAWERGERGGGIGSEIELLDEGRREEEAAEDVLMEGMGRMKIEGGGSKVEEKEKERRELALERGEKGLGMGAQKGLVEVNVLEKEVSGRMVSAPCLADEELSGRLEHLALEGYTSRFEGQQRRMVEMARGGEEMDADADGPDTDWKF